MEIRIYRTAAGARPFVAWVGALRDLRARAKIQSRLARLNTGNFGDAKSVGDGVSELRVDWGPGYRIYFSRVGQVVVLLLCAGDKKTQQKDIQRVKTYLQDYKTRSSENPDA